MKVWLHRVFFWSLRVRRQVVAGGTIHTRAGDISPFTADTRIAQTTQHAVENGWTAWQIDDVLRCKNALAALDRAPAN